MWLGIFERAIERGEIIEEKILADLISKEMVDAVRLSNPVIWRTSVGTRTLSLEINRPL